LEKFNIFTSESTKKQEKRGKEVAGGFYKNFPLLQKSPKKVQNVLAVLKPPFDCGSNLCAWMAISQPTRKTSR
jgi:hypothetical protein